MSRKSKKTGYSESLLNLSGQSNSFIWPEWSDGEINSEPWDYPKGGEYIDPRQILLPQSLEATEWKRFRTLDYVNEAIVFVAISNYCDLITNNRHLMHSEFIRSFISTVTNLQYFGRNGLEIENPTDNFSWNLGDQPWQGWFHVYSLNKAGKGAVHRPIVNPNGRYVVRIFHMGRWRRILVDDSIPIDKNGRPLLPRTSNANEIWPMVLAKAMLKIVALSWTSKREMVDCSLTTCLTGWIPLTLAVSHLSTLDQWELLCKYTNRFELTDLETSASNPDKINGLEKSTKPRKSQKKASKLEIPENPQPTLLFLSLDDSLDRDIEIPGITPCWSHQVFVESCRDVPLDPRQAKRPFARWKNHRWIKWAIRRGVINASEYFVPVRRLLIVSPLAKSHENTSASDGDQEEDEEIISSERSLMSRKISTEKARRGIINSLPKTKSEELESPSAISKWTDFNKLSYYVREIHLYYRRKFFNHKIEMCDSWQSSQSEEAKKLVSESLGREVKKSARKSTGLSGTGDKIYEYQDKKSATRNEPIYLFVDSIEPAFFIASFSTITSKITDQSVSTKLSSFVIENHNFLDKFIDTKAPLGLIKTKGTKSMVFQLEPGRHLLRIFINYETTYRALIASDTFFEIGNRLKMHQLMMTEAPRVEEMAQKIYSSMKTAFESFGTSSYSSALRNYYRSYKPNVLLPDNSVRKFLKTIDTLFIEEFSKLLEKRFSSIELPTLQRALRVFFLDPSIGRKIDSSSVKNEKWESDKESESNRSAATIQSFFRMALMKKYKKMHEPSHTEHSLTKNALFRILQVFNGEKNENAAIFLFRNFIKRDKKLVTIGDSWAAKDLEQVIEIQEISGQVENQTSDFWIPIVRIKFNIKKSEIVFGAIDLFTDLSNYTVRVFDNDTLSEMPFVVNNVSPNFYQHRENGYTIFAYGSNDEERHKEIKWSLHLATIKGEPKFYPMSSETDTFPSKIAPLFVREVSDLYTPNVQNSIFKIIVNVRTSTLVSLRFSTSYENVLTRFRITKEPGNVVRDVEGGAILVLPLIFLVFEPAGNETNVDSLENLSGSRKSSSEENGESTSSQRSVNLSRRESSEREIFGKLTRYTIEAFVREDSWPLNWSEWTVVMDSKVKEVGDIEKTRNTSTSGRKSQRMQNVSKKSFDFVKLVKPYWILQLVTEVNDLEVIRDTGRENKIAEFRKKCKAEESGRLERGQKLRQKFLDENSLIIAPSAFDVTNLMEKKLDKIEGEMGSIERLESKVSSLTKRTHDPPANLASYLPKLDLSIYMEKDEEEEDRWIKTEFDEETLRNQRAMNVIDFEQMQSSFLQDSALIIEKQREKYQRTLEIYSQNRDDRSREINQVYQRRQNFLETTKNTARSSKSKESSKTKKGR